MGRRRGYGGGFGGGGGDPYAGAKVQLSANRQALDMARFTESVQEHGDKMSLDQERNLLAKANLVYEVVKTRQAIEDKRDALVHGAAIIQKMGDLSINNPNYEKDRAAILAEHAPGLNLAKDYVKQKDSVWESQQKANQTAFNPINVGRAATDLKSAVQGFDSLAQQFIRKGQPIPEDLQAAKTNFTKYAAQLGQAGLTNMPGQPAAPTPAPQIPSGQVPATTAIPAATPAPTATPTAIATEDATSFLQSIGVGAPAPSAGTADATAAQSGLPDQANASLTTDDEND